MQPSFAISAAAVLLSCASCKPNLAVEPEKLIPDGATIIGGVDAKAVVGSKAYTDNQAMIEQGEGKATLDALRACKLGPETWQGVLVGLDSAAPDKNLAIVLTAEGLGRKENLDCIAGKHQEAEGKAPWTLEEKAGRLTLKMTEGDLTGFVVDSKTLVVAGPGWTSAVEGLLAGAEGQTSAVDGSLKSIMADVKKDHLWLAGRIPEALSQSPVEGAKHASVAINLAQGLAIAALVGYASAEDATTKAKALQDQYGLAKTFLQGANLPKAVVDGVHIEPRGSAVSVSLAISAEDVEALSARAKPLLGGLQ